MENGKSFSSKKFCKKCGSNKILSSHNIKESDSISQYYCMNCHSNDEENLYNPKIENMKQIAKGNIENIENNCNNNIKFNDDKQLSNYNNYLNSIKKNITNIEDIKEGTLRFQKSDSTNSESGMRGMVFINYIDYCNRSFSELEENNDLSPQDKIFISSAVSPLNAHSIHNNNNNNNNGNNDNNSNNGIHSNNNNNNNNLTLSSCNGLSSESIILPNNGQLKRNNCTLNSNDICLSHTPSS